MLAQQLSFLAVEKEFNSVETIFHVTTGFMSQKVTVNTQKQF